MIAAEHLSCEVEPEELQPDDDAKLEQLEMDEHFKREMLKEEEVIIKVSVPFKGDTICWRQKGDLWHLREGNYTFLILCLIHLILLFYPYQK